MPIGDGALKADAGRVGEDVDRGVDHARDALADFTRQARELFDESVERLGAQLREGGKDAKGVAEEQLSSARLYVVDRVHERPLTVTLAALGVGVVVGLLFAGGSRR